MHSDISRRTFVKSAAAAGLATALSASRVAGANDALRVAFIGVGNRGSQLIEGTLPHKDVQIVAICDVAEPALDKWQERLGNNVARYTDFRKVLERDDIDAIILATPDHWHAVQTVMACAAGKDVYCEKPLSMTLVEGRKMVEAARKYDRVVTAGLHRRSSPMYAKLADYIQDDGIGKVTVSRAYRLNNMYPDGIGRLEDTKPPKGLDWDLWLGPRGERPYRDNIAPYKFRWWKAYSSQLGNWGVHYFDLLRWILGEEHPASVSAHGGRFAVNDDRTIPDTLHCTYEFGSGRLLLFGQYEASGHPMFPPGMEVELRGTNGILYAGGRGYEVIPENGGQFQDPAPRMEPVKEPSNEHNANLTSDHIRNFLDCVKSRKKPNADVEDAHKSTIFSHLGNIALATESRIEWDPATETIVGNDEANELLHYEYRKPWTLEM